MVNTPYNTGLERTHCHKHWTKSFHVLISVMYVALPPGSFLPNQSYCGDCDPPLGAPWGQHGRPTPSDRCSLSWSLFQMQVGQETLPNTLAGVSCVGGPSCLVRSDFETFLQKGPVPINVSEVW